MKHRIVHLLQKYLLNPPIKLLFAVGVAPPGCALTETLGRKGIIEPWGRLRWNSVQNTHLEDKTGVQWPLFSESKRKSQVREGKAMQSPFHVRNLIFGSAVLLVLFGTAAAQTVPVSGYEIYLGHNCTVAGAPATCGATFTGWTGETSGGGWLAFPGTGKGVWSIQINYTGHPAFGGTTPQVTIVGGKWSFLFVNGLELRGKVISGTVTWPTDQNSSVDGSICGPGVAVAQANMSLVGGKSATVAGCLHDIPAGTVIPPQEWGAFTFSF